MHRSFMRAAGAGAVLLGLVATTADAHHSFNAYDMSKTQSAAGTIKEFRWGAPHSSMVLVYADGDKVSEMSVVSGSPLAFSKQGFAPRDFHKGDKVSVTYHPNISGSPGGALASLTTGNGRTFSDAEAANAAPGGPPK